MVEVVSTKPGTIQGYNEFEMADSIAVDRLVKEATPAAYDALLLPGGTINGDKLRGDADVLVFVRGVADAGKPIAAICHAPWILIDAGIASGRKLTSYPTIRLDLENAGAVWMDEAAVVDGNLLTSRDPDDLPSFNRAMVDLFSV